MGGKEGNGGLVVTALVLDENCREPNDARWMYDPHRSGADRSHSANERKETRDEPRDLRRRIRKMELRKSHRCENATTERQTHTFEHLAAKKTPSTVFALWDSRHQQGKHGCKALAQLTRGDIHVARPHVEGPRACPRQDGAALAYTHHT
jgi:hypothetical protein